MDKYVTKAQMFATKFSIFKLSNARSSGTKGARAEAESEFENLRGPTKETF